MQKKQFLTPADVAQELDIGTTTVLGMIHAGSLPAIRVSKRKLRIPSASLDMYKAGTRRTATAASRRLVKQQPHLGAGEALPTSRPATDSLAD
jgi:excisionase family DNA binding protein